VSADIPAVVRARMNAHLDAVETQLASTGVPREKRRSIIDDLETHILEMVRASDPQPVTEDEINAMIARLDPPEAYGTEEIAAQNSPAPLKAPGPVDLRLCPGAKRGVFWIALAIVAQLFVLGALTPRTVVVQPTTTGSFVQSDVPNSAPPPQPMPAPPTAPILGTMLFVAAGAVAIVAPIVGTLFGWMAVEEIKRLENRFYGLALAVFAALFYPLIVIWVGASIVWYRAVAADSAGPVSDRARTLWTIGAFASAALLTAALCWVLRRALPGASIGGKLALSR